MNDIQSDEDIELLVQTFYEQVVEHDLLAPSFTTDSDIDWTAHLPRMVEFWKTILFRVPGYKGDPFHTHAVLRQRTTLTPEHFTVWVALFHTTVDGLFAGERADFAKKSAAQMGRGLTHTLFTGTERFVPDL